MNLNELKQKEKNIECYSWLLCKSDVCTDYSILTQELSNLSKQNSTEFIFKKSVKSYVINQNSIEIIFTDNSSVECNFLINCSGCNSLDIAK